MTFMVGGMRSFLDAPPDPPYTRFVFPDTMFTFFFFRIRGQYLKIGKFHINIQTAGLYQNIEQFGKRATFHMAIISVPMQSTDTALTLSVSLPQVI